MIVIDAVVRNGRIETDTPLNLPDGTALKVSLVTENDDSVDGWDNSPAGIEAWLNWYATLQPLIFTETERATLEAERSIRREREKANFGDYAEKLAKDWN